MKIKKGIFIASAAIMLSLATVGTFAYQINNIDRECTGDQQMIRSRLNSEDCEYAEERTQNRRQLNDGECDGSMMQARLRANR